MSKPHSHSHSHPAPSLAEHTPPPCDHSPPPYRQSYLRGILPFSPQPRFPLPPVHSNATYDIPEICEPPPELTCHGSLIHYEPVARSPMLHGQPALPGHQGSSALPTYPPLSTVPNIVEIQLCRKDGPSAFTPGATSYYQEIRGVRPRGIIQAGTRIVCPSFKGWGTGPTDRARIAVRIKGIVGNRTIVQLDTIPSSGGVVPGADTVYVYFFTPYPIFSLNSL
ncbi:uncharacterized protein LACBIDRAFT_325987 [Laccaria bicolor S238N-H82]|uniref:Predicted protein n=1 Tax=Laccaria bicolor (strain S238N-H82 / ATCC MYA-4686) TaxID=486041 RepID=B0D6X0_LACBS|nr:uncharacterized protein LACBIDRAFT_325987 [Laccaria bicolor S238N-H82]EDR09295.1 predicted protein [Laccaria bicolor S238N-H82]|eukprot:XP_001879644.1 predicted protein [Laccaria bicolor S238N-H82]